MPTISTGFSRWWNCPKKHLKRLRYWIPEAKKLHDEIGQRPFRYFTLCSREMIDVFSLVREGVLHRDNTLRKIGHVKFCERDEQIVPEIIEMLGHEDAGFKGNLDEIVLFRDGEGSEQLRTMQEIELELEQQGESMESRVRDKLNAKRNYLMLRESFPFDFLNLDFCDPFYPDPPDTMRVSDTIDRIVEWQKRSVFEQGKSFPLKRFLLAITCRHDKSLSGDAHRRLTRIVQANQRQYPNYKRALSQDVFRSDIRKWSKGDRLDFFMSSWPKEIMRMLEQHQWRTSIRGLVYYDRTDKKGMPYVIVSLLYSCEKVRTIETHEMQSLWLLKKENRDKIANIRSNTREGKHLRNHFKQVVSIRNKQALSVSRLPLPNRPLFS